MSVLVLLLPVLLVLGVSITARSRPAAPVLPDPADLMSWHLVRQRAAVRLAVGVPLAGLAGWATARWDFLGRGLAVAVPVACVVVLAAVVAGEVGIRPPRAVVRTASLQVRRRVDYLPHRLAAGVAAAAGVLLVVLVATTAGGSADDLGRAGRSLQTSCGSAGPWPGSFYAAPLALAVITGLVVTAGGIHQLTRRPRLGSMASSDAADDALRRLAGRRIVAACGVLVAVPLLGVALTAGADLLRVSCQPPSWRVFGWALLGVAAAAVGLLGWSAGNLLPATRRPRARRG